MSHDSTRAIAGLAPPLASDTPLTLAALAALIEPETAAELRRRLPHRTGHGGAWVALPAEAEEALALLAAEEGRDL